MSAGVIDRDFGGEAKVLLRNFSGREFWMRRGDRIAQLIGLPEDGEASEVLV